MKLWRKGERWHQIESVIDSRFSILYERRMCIAPEGACICVFALASFSYLLIFIYYFALINSICYGFLSFVFLLGILCAVVLFNPFLTFFPRVLCLSHIGTAAAATSHRTKRQQREEKKKRSNTQHIGFISIEYTIHATQYLPLSFVPYSM